jgi:hypothetical protein
MKHKITKTTKDTVETTIVDFGNIFSAIIYACNTNKHKYSLFFNFVDYRTSLSSTIELFRDDETSLKYVHELIKKGGKCNYNIQFLAINCNERKIRTVETTVIIQNLFEFNFDDSHYSITVE